jgi:hypothetical protein
MESHMRMLKINKQRGQRMEDSVFLINTYYLLSKCLAKIMVRNHQDFYKELYQHSSQIGLKNAVKYLGK